MASVKNTTGIQNIAFIKIPLGSFKCISSYPKEKKVLCEINVKDLRTINNPETVDELINVSRLDYALGKYKTFSRAKDLIKELRS